MQKFSGMDYLRIDIANQYGFDKEPWADRIAWTKAGEMTDTLELMADKAEEPVLYRKAVRALKAAKEGVSIGHPVGLDATASGIQIMAALMGCHTTAERVNLIDTGKREDVYQHVADIMGTHIGRTISKAEIKKPVMTTFYGSKNQPKSVFGEDTPELSAFYQTLAEELPGAMECMDDMQSCWQPGALKHEWTLPDGHVASIKVMQAVDKKIEVDELNHATFTHRMYQNIGSEKGLSLAANIIHSIDGYIVREMTRRANKQGFQLLHIHDSFWCMANHVDDMRNNYRQILADIADMNLLEDIISEVLGRQITLHRSSTNLGVAIRNSEYALS